MLKRTFDIVVALAGLLLSSPLMVLVAALILYTDGRPILFREKRVGRGGRLFSILKFRTLRTGHEHERSVAPEDDPRQTRTGRWLRRWRLDEFPQFINVLKGDMSVVGPRPMSPKHADALTETQRAELFTVRPGLTSPASIAFLAEDAVLANHPDAERLYLEKILPAKVEMELEYVRTRTFRGDLGVILSTLNSLWSSAKRENSADMIKHLLED